MSKLRCHISVSIDGYAAGPNQSLDQPLGEGGEGLHEWVVSLAGWRKAHAKDGGEVNASSAVFDESRANIGATVMGRNMFGGGPGPWNEEKPWVGWWGEDPPFHHPVFVLTHHPRERLEMNGGTSFVFVHDGIEAALERATEAAAGKDVLVAGGAEAIQQYLAAGLLDELTIHVVPIVLGGGARLLDNIGTNVRLEQIDAVQAPGVTHLKYRALR